MESISRKPLMSGDLIFECNPVIHCVGDESKGKNCDNCLQRSDSLKKCAKCFNMYYCNRECQENDWNHHKNECKVYRHKNFKIGSDAERLLLRLWLCVKSDPKFATKKYKAFDGTEICLNELDFDNKNVFKDQMAYAFFVQITLNFENFGLFYDRKQLLNWFSLIAPGSGYTHDLNCYSDSPSKMSYLPFEANNYRPTVGSGVFIQLPLLSHSCVPNANIITNGLKLQYRAIKAIGLGQKIETSIVELGEDKGYRTQMLAMSSIKCKCDKCRLNLDKDIDYEDYNDLLRANRHNWSLIDDPIKAKIENKDYVIDENLFMYMRAIFGGYHSQISEALLLSFICFALHSKKSSKSLIKLWYKRIETSVRVTHGSDHSIYKLLNNVYLKSIN